VVGVGPEYAAVSPVSGRPTETARGAACTTGEGTRTASSSEHAETPLESSRMRPRYLQSVDMKPPSRSLSVERLLA
jgi:hypothetical protein